jgi:glutathione S-transferase
MKLYEFGPTRSIRARWALQELEVPFESVVVKLPEGEHKETEYLRLNPAGKLPTLVDGDFVLTESAAIVKYLAEKYPEKRLWPTSLRDRAEADRWMLFTVTELEQPLWRIARHSFVYPEEQRIAGDIDIAKREFRDMVQVLEHHLREREFVASNHITVTDFVVAYTLDWANEEGLLDYSPALRSYMERMYARPHAAMRISQAMASVGLAS